MSQVEGRGWEIGRLYRGQPREQREDVAREDLGGLGREPREDVLLETVLARVKGAGKEKLDISLRVRVKGQV